MQGEVRNEVAVNETMNAMGPAHAENIAPRVNLAFRPERFFIDGDRTDPDKVRTILRKGLSRQKATAAPMAVSSWNRRRVNLRVNLPGYYPRFGYLEWSITFS